MRKTWDDKYNSKQFLYGKEPNTYFAEKLRRLPLGKLLLPAEGEGRNAVFAAGLGWYVHAVDSSAVAKAKALRFAEDLGVKITYDVSDLLEAELKPESYDVIGMAFLHLPPNIRQIVHRKLQAALKPGGIFIANAFSKEQLKHGTGGPPIEALLYTTEQLQADFDQMEIAELETKIITLNEGTGHRGKASVIHFYGKKV